ncbi:MAG TPA: hypothetical protein VK041_10530, partial [Opitutales bacterium]|nr:hypothetical protein [Opitutales bacterium]
YLDLFSAVGSLRIFGELRYPRGQLFNSQRSVFPYHYRIVRRPFLLAIGTAEEPVLSKGFDLIFA